MAKKDLSDLYYEVINTPEFKAFHKRVGGKLTSSTIQIERCNIEIEDVPGKHKWIFYSNGYVRESEYVTYMGQAWRAKVIAKPPTNWPNPNKLTVKDMTSLIAKAETRINKRVETFNNKINKIEKKKNQVFDMLFNPEQYEKESYGMGPIPFRVWSSELRFDTLIEEIYRDIYGSNKYTKK